MAAVADLLNTAGPYAGWVCFALVVVAGLWAYATDRIVSAGRHREQADHYQERITEAKVEADQYRGDRDYWRDIALDLMSTVASSVERAP